MIIVDIFTQVINAFLHIYIVFFFLSTFCERKYGKLATVISLAIMMAALCCTLLFMPIGIMRFIPICLLSFSVTILFRIKLVHKLIYAAIIYAIIAIFEVLTEIGISILFVNSFILSNSKSMFIVGMLISKTLSFLVTLAIRLRKHNSLSSKLNKKYWGILLLPLATLMLAILITLLFTATPNQSIITYILVLTTFTVLIVSNLIIFDFIDTISEVYSYESKMAMADKIIDAQTSQYQALIDYNKDIMKLRHDHKNFCIGLLSVLKENNTEIAIEKISEEFNLCLDDSLLNTNVIQILIDIKRKCISQNNVCIEYDFKRINNILISPTDLSIIIGNALDNAIEACENIQNESTKTIRVSITGQNDNIFIIIANPISKTIDINNLTTSKKNMAKYHGLGILSMKKIAEKYDGEIYFDSSNGIFTTTIMLLNKTNN